MTNKKIREAVNYIIDEVRENAGDLSGGTNWIIGYDEIEKKFGYKLNGRIKSDIMDELENNKKIADVYQCEDGFDVVIYNDDDEETEESE